MSDPTNEQITMGFDAMRICIGDEPRNHPAAEVLKFLGAKVKEAALSSTPSDERGDGQSKTEQAALIAFESAQARVHRLEDELEALKSVGTPPSMQKVREALEAAQGKLPELQWNGECGSGPTHSPCPVRAKIDEALSLLPQCGAGEDTARLNLIDQESAVTQPYGNTVEINCKLRLEGGRFTERFDIRKVCDQVLAEREARAQGGGK